MRSACLGVAAFRLAPAAVAGLVAGNHLHSAGHGILVFVAVLLASFALDRDRYPIHLMPLSGGLLRAFVPVFGAGIALATFALAGQPEPASALVAAVISAWVVMAFAGWSKVRFESSRQVRVAVIGSAGLARGLHEELRSAGIRAYSVVGWIAGDAPTTEPGGRGPRRLGSLEQVRDVVSLHSVDLLVHASVQASGDEPRHSRLEVFERVAASCLDLPVRLIEASQLYEELLGHVPLGQSNSAWFQYLLHPRYRPGLPGSKRAFDVIVGSLMLVLLAPVIARPGPACEAHRRRPGLLPPAPHGRERRGLRDDQASLDAGRRRRRAEPAGPRPTTIASPRSVAPCAAPTSTRSPSSGT